MSHLLSGAVGWERVGYAGSDASSCRQLKFLANQESNSRLKAAGLLIPYLRLQKSVVFHFLRQQKGKLGSHGFVYLQFRNRRAQIGKDPSKLLGCGSPPQDFANLRRQNCMQPPFHPTSHHRSSIFGSVSFLPFNRCKRRKPEKRENLVHDSQWLVPQSLCRHDLYILGPE